MAIISIGRNLSALQTASKLSRHTTNLSSIYDRLASGQRINKASDDAAGLAISMNLQSAVKVQARSQKNIGDGLSVASIMEGAISSLVDITIRRKELAEQAANGVYTDAQRLAMDKEFYELDKEYERIINSTSFNGLGLLNGTQGNLTIQAGESEIGINLEEVYTQLTGIDPTSTLPLIGYSRMYTGNAMQAGGMTAQVAVGDVNNDGIPDVIASDYGTNDQCGTTAGYSNGVYTVITRADGTVYNGDKTDMGTTSRPYSVDLADINGDGNLDMIAGTIQKGKVYVATNDGNGNFSSATDVSTFKVLVGMTTGDYNGDGKADIITTGKTTSGGSYGVYVQTGNGDGTFSAATKLANVATGAFAVETADLDGNNSDEIIIGTRATSGGTIQIINNGASKTLYSGSKQVFDVTTGDFDGDGNLDIAAAVGNEIQFYINDGSGNFTKDDTNTITFDDNVTALATGDIDGDGKTDVAAVQSGKNAVTTIFNMTEADTLTMVKARSFDTGEAPSDITLADINGDGKDDAIVANSKDGTVGVSLADKPSLKITTRQYALQALDALDTTLSNLDMALSTIGAFESRLTTASNVAQVAQENFARANSAICDTDVAADSAELVKTNILQQACTAVLAQANIQPKIALKLLEDI